MVTYVFDASGIIRLLDGEEGAVDVNEIFKKARRNECHMAISAVNWGEIARYLYETSTPNKAYRTLLWLQGIGLEVVDATAERAVAAGLLRLKYGIGYADCFGIELASEANHILVTADYGAKPAEQQVTIQWLPVKPRR